MNMVCANRLRGHQLRLFFLLLLLGGLSIPASAQKPLELLPITPIGKKVTATEGYLGILTTPHAVVTLSGKENRVLNADQNGMVVFDKLLPGIYAYRIDLDDYHPLERKQIRVKPGKPEVAVDRLLPVFSTLALVMGELAGRDVRVWINEKPITPDQIEARDGKVLVKRLQLPDNVFHLIRIEKPYHEGIIFQRLIQLGECENVVSVDLAPLKGSLILSGNAGARIYLDGEDKGLLTSDGQMRLPGLVPGQHQLRAELLGFASLDRPVRISPGKEGERLEFRLEPEVEKDEISYAFREEKDQFSPRLPEGWRVETAKSLQMAGAGLALLKSGAIPEQPFSVFEDATMIFQVREWNGGGIGWVARAVDLRNYYKFELLPTSRDHAQPYELTFSLCRDGVCQPPDRYLLETIKAEDLRSGQFRIVMTVSKDQIWQCITTQDGKKRPLGPTLVAPVFTRGGSGMSGVEGASATIVELRLLPGVFESADCQDPR